MEFPDLGKHCSEPTCKRLDFLPLKCDACNEIFCHEHMKYTTHNCPSAYKKNVQVPVCPLCSQPVPVARNQQPDEVVGAHMDNDCQSQPAQDRRKKIFTNRCSMKGCRQKEVVPVICQDCCLNFCLRHRHMVDHNCEGKQAATRNRAAAAAAARQNNAKGSSAMASASAAANRLFSKPSTKSSSKVAVQSSMSEDEALARAIQESMKSNQSTPKAAAVSPPMSQEEEDRLLAMAIAESEREQRRQQRQSSTSNTRNSEKSCYIA